MAERRLSLLAKRPNAVQLFECGKSFCAVSKLKLPERQYPWFGKQPFETT
jgi:hypothetical protein